MSVSGESVCLQKEQLGMVELQGKHLDSVTEYAEDVFWQDMHDPAYRVVLMGQDRHLTLLLVSKLLIHNRHPYDEQGIHLLTDVVLSR